MPRRRSLAGVTLALLLASAAALLWLAERALSDHPLPIPPTPEPPPSRSNPRLVSRAELSRLAAKALSPLGTARVETRIHFGGLRLAASVRLARGRYLNATLRLHRGLDGWRVSGLRVGRLDVPPRLAGLLMSAAQALSASPELVALLTRGDLRPQPGLLALGSATPPLPMPPSPYAALLRSNPPGTGPGDTSLTRLLTPLFALAAHRSAAADPVEENRRAILALGAALLDGGAPASLAGRHDLARHFAVSAALAVASGEEVAAHLGLLKERRDARGGSGFSFPDLAADRAGLRFARAATRSPAAARRLQRLAAAGLREDDLMPSIEGLPEGLSAATFERRFGAADTPRYRATVALIERRLGACRLYGSQSSARPRP